jgi:Undecaprenyl-phosphate galactose phosphotransferase WbaP
MASALASASLAELPYRLVRVPKVLSKPLRCALTLACSDSLALLTSLGIGFCAVALGESLSASSVYLHLWPSLLIFAAVFLSLGLYPGVICNPVRELERLVVGICLSFSMFAAAVWMDGLTSRYSPAFFVIAWGTALIAVPASRTGVRCLFSRRPWWGVPAVVVYTGEESLRLLKLLHREKQLGIHVAAVLASSETPRDCQYAPVFDLRQATALREAGVSHALIAMPDGSAGTQFHGIDSLEHLFPRLLLMSDVLSNCSLNTTVHDVQGSLTIEICRNLLRPFPTLLKRTIDATLLLLLAPFLLPLILLLGWLVTMESPGGMFYCHRRIGKNNQTIRVWKIRTMYANSDVLLKRALQDDPALRTEWLTTRKLLRDPRVTPLGRLIRRASLDELPQLWNVLCGEMSFVGPRPIVQDEIAIYGDRFPLYCRVAPGLTGLWQVSGRNDTSLSDRVRLDSYYVKNWSPWLDCHILLLTIGAVLSGKGAY